MSLIRKAAAECDVVAVTDYVNPLQFGPTEDLGAYPKDLGRDCELAAEAGAGLLLAPTSEQVWPDGKSLSTVRVVGLTDRLEGAARPGHFDGVTTIVCKLFAATGPCRAYFGEKDYQQLAVVRRMVSDLSLPVGVVGCPIVRDPDGLALSSRNAYLSDVERSVASRLYHSLLAGKRAIEEGGVTDPDEVEEAIAGHLSVEARFELDYAVVADPTDLTRPAQVCAGEVRLLAAARLGAARLIDNMSASAPSAEQ
jgi:pantoate--beta-alanine ligase